MDGYLKNENIQIEKQVTKISYSNVAASEQNVFFLINVKLLDVSVQSSTVMFVYSVHL